MAGQELPEDIIMSVKRAYMSGTPKTKIAAMHDISRHTVTSYEKKYGWKKEKAEIEERASEKYVEKMSDMKSTEAADVNKDHYDILDILRERLKEAIAGDNSERIKEVNQQINAADNLIVLERSVKGLDLEKKLPKINVPEAIRMTIVSPDGTVTTVNSAEITSEQEQNLEEMLPNQSESHYGPIEAKVIESEDEDDDIILEPEVQKIASLDF